MPLFRQHGAAAIILFSYRGSFLTVNQEVTNNVTAS